MSAPEHVHISSFIVMVNPQHLAGIERQLQTQPMVEIYGQDQNGKIIIVLETSSEHAMLDTISHIENLSGVLSVTLVYHQLDEINEGEMS